MYKDCVIIVYFFSFFTMLQWRSLEIIFNQYLVDDAGMNYFHDCYYFLNLKRRLKPLFFLMINHLFVSIQLNLFNVWFFFIIIVYLMWWVSIYGYWWCFILTEVLNHSIYFRLCYSNTISSQTFTFLSQYSFDIICEVLLSQFSFFIQLILYSIYI